MEFLRIALRVLGITIYAYTGIVFITFILGLFYKIRITKFYYVLNIICYPFNKIFMGRLIVAGILDIGGTIGLFMLSVISQFFISLSYRI